MKAICIMTLFFVVTVACKKQTATQETPQEEVYSYKGSDGSRSKITLINTPRENTMTIEANGNKFQLDKKSANVYERNGIKAEIVGDSLFINQDNLVIALARADQ